MRISSLFRTSTAFHPRPLIFFKLFNFNRSRRFGDKHIFKASPHNSLLDTLLDDKDIARQHKTQRIEEYIQDNLSNFGARDIADLLLKTSKKKFSLKPIQLKELSTILSNKYPDLRAKDVSNIMYGLRMYEEDQGILASLCRKLQSSHMDEYTDAILSRMLYGLQKIGGNEEKLQVFVQSVLPFIKKSRGRMSTREISAALYGLQRAKGRSEQLLELISVLSVKISQSKELLNAQAIGNTLYGLQGMSSDAKEVLSLISVLSVKISQSKELLSAQEIGNALYGLQGMSSNSKEMLGLISTLTVKLSQSKHLLSVQHLSFQEVTSLYQSLVLFALCNDARIRSIADPMKELENQLFIELESKASLDIAPRFASATERKFFQYAISACKNVNISVDIAHNQMLHGFEADIVMKLNVSPNTQHTINVELDGPHHKRSKTLRFCNLRDLYLQREHNVQIHRLDVSGRTVQSMTAHDAVAWFVTLINNSTAIKMESPVMKGGTAKLSHNNYKTKNSMKHKTISKK